MKLVKQRKISLKNHDLLNESWLQDVIAKDPSILDLGELSLKDKERIQPRAGRLDLLLQDPDTGKRFEVEIQLGKTDESHIIRTIEYWDLERKRYPQYEHTAVIIAEEITARFLNVISLFNGHIPLVAIQVNAYEVGEDISLIFTKILDENHLGLVDDDEKDLEVTDRAYWEKEKGKGTPKTVKIVDKALELINSVSSGYSLKYNKFYIGMINSGKTDNFIIFRPKKQWASMEIRLDKSDEVDEILDNTDMIINDYDKRYGRYRISLKDNDISKYQKVLLSLIAKSMDIHLPEE